MEHRPGGRWGGKLTQHPLPERDDTIDALSPSDREELAVHWLQRGASERRVGDSFSVIRETLNEAHASAELLQLAERAVDDELRHAELSRQVASRFAGRELDSPPLLPLSIPEHKGAPAELKRTLHILGQCSLNETFASAVLEASLAATTGPLAKAAIRELLSDEIDHARIGWAHLGGLDARARAELVPWLLRLVQANLRTWRTTPREYPSNPKLIEQGAISESMLETALRSALHGLIIPGFRYLGLPVESLSRWVDQGAPT